MAVEIRRNAISVASNGNNVIVPAAQGQAIKVLACLLMANADVNVKFTNGANGANLTGALPMGTKGNGFILPPAPPGQHWLETSQSTALVLHLSAAVQVSGLIVYYVE